MEFVIQKASFAATEVGVEIVGLQAIDDGSAFANTPAPELQDGYTACCVFIRFEDLAARFCIVARDLSYIGSHA